MPAALSRPAWHAAAAAALVATVLGREATIGARYDHALANGAPPDALVELAAMAHLFGGYPRAIQGLRQLELAFGRRGLAAPPAVEATPRARADDRRRGEELFRQIYGDHSDAVLALLDTPCRGFAECVLEDAYGRILSRPGLAAVDREWFAVAALTALDCPSQLKSHVRGALRLGVPPAELAALADHLTAEVTPTAIEQLRATLRELSATS